MRELDDEAAAAIMLAENIGRADLNPMEEACTYHSRMERFGWDDNRVAEVAGVSVDLVKRRLSLLRLVPEAQKLVASGKNAKVNVPRPENLPQVQAMASDTVGEVFVWYITILSVAGYEQEAGAVGNLFERLVKGNWLSIPRPGKA